MIFFIMLVFVLLNLNRIIKNIATEKENLSKITRPVVSDLEDLVLNLP